MPSTVLPLPNPIADLILNLHMRAEGGPKDHPRAVELLCQLDPLSLLNECFLEPSKVSIAANELVFYKRFYPGVQRARR